MLARPSSWETVALADLVLFALGGDWGKAPDFDADGYLDVRCIRGSELRDWDNEKGVTAALRRVKKESLASRQLVADDILVEISGGGPNQPVGRIVLIDQAALSNHPETPKICTNFFRLIRPTKQVSSAFLNIFLKYFYNTGEINRYQGGSNNLRNLKFNDYLTISVPLPPQNEQHRIVAKIEELFSELDKGIENLKTAREQLKVYRQAVLKHAFEGRLTAKWREENADKLESPEQLLARINDEREMHRRNRLEVWKVAVSDWERRGRSGRKPPKPSEPKLIVGIGEEEAQAADLSSLPEGSIWARLGDISDISGGLTKNPRRKTLSRQLKYLRVANVYADRLLIDEVYQIGVTDDEARQVVLEPGDLLVVEGNGSIEQIGRVALWTGELEECGHQNHLIRVRVAINSNPRFLLQYLLSPVGRQLITKEASSTSGLHTLSISKLSRLIAPIVQPLEAAEILKEIDEKTSITDALLDGIEKEISRAKSLRQSILKKAFSGQLVAQDPDDEPAFVLLARIQAENAEQEKRSKPPKKKKGAKASA